MGGVRTALGGGLGGMAGRDLVGLCGRRAQGAGLLGWVGGCIGLVVSLLHGCVGVENAQGTEVEIVEGDEEEGHHGVTDAEMGLAKEEDGDGEQHELGKGVGMEAGAVETPHTDGAVEGEAVEDACHQIEGPGSGDERLIGYEILLGHGGEGAGIEHLSDHGQKSAHAKIGKAVESGTNEGEDEDDVKGGFLGHEEGVRG